MDVLGETRLDELEVIRTQVRTLGEQILAGQVTSNWVEVLDFAHGTRVDHLLASLLRAYLIVPTMVMESSTGENLDEQQLTKSQQAEVEAFGQICHTLLHELLVHIRDKRKFAIDGWVQLQAMLLASLTEHLAQLEQALIAQTALREFLLIASDAGLILTREIRDAFRRWMESSIDEGEADEDVQHHFMPWQDPFLSMLNQVSEGGKRIDEFDCYNNIENQIIFLPLTTLEDVFSHGVSFQRPEVKELIPLMVLHPCEDVGLTALTILQQQTSDLTAVSLSRLICVRNWLPTTRIDPLDSIVRAVRLRLAGETPKPSHRDLVSTKHLASTVDGSGAQNVMSLLSSPFGFKVFVGVVKEHIGWVDVWSSAWTTRAECERIIRSFQKSVYTLEVSGEYVEFIFGQGLYWCLESAVIPHPEMLHWIEMLGFSPLNPKDYGSDEMRGLLQLDVGELSEMVRQDTLAASKRWLRQSQFAVGWFEAGDHVEDYLQGELPQDPAELVTHCVEHLFSPLRHKWASRFYWLSYWSQSNLKRRGPKSKDFAIMAQIMHEGSALADIPVIRDLALATLGAYAPSSA